MKAILFDLFGTLVPNLPSIAWEKSSSQVASILQIDADLYQELWAARFRDRMVGQILDGDHQFDGLLEEAKIEVPIERRRRAAQLHRDLLREVLVPKPETCSTLDQILSAGLQLALVTDCSSAAPELLDETALGRYFQTRSISAYLGVRKPDPKMYAHSLDALGLAAEECIYVGDGNSEELLGAKKCGLVTVWVDNGPQQHWHERFAPTGDHTIRSLDELLPIIHSLRTT